MTVRTRVIPCLDVANGRVVKGVNFVDLKDAGDPPFAQRAFNGSGEGCAIHGLICPPGLAGCGTPGNLLKVLAD
jgi:hypothetical protein